MKNISTSVLTKRREQLLRWAAQNRSSFSPLVEPAPARAIDLSSDRLAALPKLQEAPIQTLSDHLDDQIYRPGYTYGYGGYNERRPFYRFPLFTPAGAPIRDLHLGLDVWCVAGTPILAPAAGRVHSYAYDPAAGSYGATIILAHDIGTDTPFFTLYGHLQRASLQDLQVGQILAAGSVVAHVGAPQDNGGWPPHLHFQLMLDDLGMVGDFPGVASYAQRQDWLALCPDPQEVFGWEWGGLTK